MSFVAARELVCSRLNKTDFLGGGGTLSVSNRQVLVEAFVRWPSETLMDPCPFPETYQFVGGVSRAADPVVFGFGGSEGDD